MKRYKGRTVIALIAGVYILTLFCGSIFACILSDMEKGVVTMARCSSSSDQSGDKDKNVCVSTEIAQSQNHFKLPQDIKEIKAITFLDQDQIFHSDQISLMQVNTNLIERVYIPDKVEIFIKDLSLRL